MKKAIICLLLGAAVSFTAGQAIQRYRYRQAEERLDRALEKAQSDLDDLMRRKK